MAAIVPPVMLCEVESSRLLAMMGAPVTKPTGGRTTSPITERKSGAARVAVGAARVLARNGPCSGGRGGSGSGGSGMKVLATSIPSQMNASPTSTPKSTRFVTMLPLPRNQSVKLKTPLAIRDCPKL